jgi:hypothetical protein
MKLAVRVSETLGYMVGTGLEEAAYRHFGTGYARTSLMTRAGRTPVSF